MDYRAESLKKHYEWRGKLDITPRVPVENRDDLSLAYTPGVAEPCLEIEKDLEKSFALTGRGNLVAVVTDGSAVLGLGNIGPEAGMPVMEGKCVLFKAFGGVDAIPLCIKSGDVDEIVRTVYLLSGSFGGINLEDISAPRCFEIERRLQELCDIPIFHDDQHGTAVVTAAALKNALKVVNKRIEDVRCVINGAGAAGISVAKLLQKMGIGEIVLVSSRGIIAEDTEGINPAQREMAKVTNPRRLRGKLAVAMKDADVFIGLSVPGVVSGDMVRSMAKGSIVFPMSNPTPEIDPEEAIKAGAAVVGTGRSDFDNQINNVLAFPGILRGALDTRARCINDAMKLAAAHAIADLISNEDLRPGYIIPFAFDKRVGPAVGRAVANAAMESGVARTTPDKR
ncbi:MAG: NADP-dependent malic enzyme [Clostridiales bacterium]|nr:NADP-dependent malic enzyme [Clostridiales bacterium]